MNRHYPIRFTPIYRDYIWGGDRILKKYHREASSKRVAESWEVADRKDGMSVVMNGPLKGRTLHQLVEEMGEDLIGKDSRLFFFSSSCKNFGRTGKFEHPSASQS